MAREENAPHCDEHQAMMFNVASQRRIDMIGEIQRLCREMDGPDNHPSSKATCCNQVLLPYLISIDALLKEISSRLTHLEMKVDCIARKIH